jgi:hypothetical protein
LIRNEQDGYEGNFTVTHIIGNDVPNFIIRELAEQHSGNNNFLETSINLRIDIEAGIEESNITLLSRKRIDQVIKYSTITQTPESVTISNAPLVVNEIDVNKIKDKVVFTNSTLGNLQIKLSTDGNTVEFIKTDNQGGVVRTKTL